MPIPLPNASGREQILAIHLRRARDAGLVSPEVNDAVLAEKTDGFSGADLAGLVRSATSFAIADWRERLDGARAGTTGSGDADSDEATSDYSDLDENAVGSGTGGGGHAVEISAGNFKQALREVEASDSGRARRRRRRRRRFGRVGALGGALRDGLGGVLSTTVDGEGG